MKSLDGGDKPTQLKFVGNPSDWPADFCSNCRSSTTISLPVSGASSDSSSGERPEWDIGQRHVFAGRDLHRLALPRRLVLPRGLDRRPGEESLATFRV